MSHDEDELLRPFDDPKMVAKYVEGPPRFVPGFADIHKMASILLAERAPGVARVLVLGAGGGLELKAFAEMNAGWRFDGVDPAAEMLELARQTVAPYADRMQLHEGYIDDAPEGPFDAGACLLTLHFLKQEERRRTLAEIHRRLKPGAPFVAVHSSFPQAGEERDRWLSRYVAFALGSGADPEQVRNMREAVSRSLSLLTPEEDEAVLRAAGFADVTPFYAAFTWRGWVAYA